ncbi:MAG TPA: ATP-binding protein [Pseudonocardia sp.]|nr:ATP-binding protein [Pseudonocardia sp.]
MPGSGGCAIGPSVGAAAAAFDDLPDAVWEVRGEELRVATANRAARSAAASGTTVLGSRFGEVGEGLDAPELTEALLRVLRTGESVRDLRWRRSGPTPPRGTRYVIDADQVRGGDGAVRGVLVRARELTGALLRSVMDVPPDDARATHPGAVPSAAGPVAGPARPEHMPEQVPVVRGVRLAAHHVSAPPGAGAGEWFDVIALPGGRVALAVGSVGRQASPAAEVAAVSTLRAVLQDCLLAGGGLPEAVRRLDSVAGRNAGVRGATVAVVVLDPATGRFEHARCGHQPALVCGPRPARVVDGDAGGPLGVGASRPVLRPDVLDRDDLLLLHTGGPVEGRRPVARWLGALADDVGRLWPPEVTAGRAGPADSSTALDVFCVRLVDRTGSADGPSTAPGLTVLAAARPADDDADLRLEVPAVPAELGPLRAALTGWLEDLGATAEAVTAVPLVVSELVSNTMEHAYPQGEPGAVRVHAGLDGSAGLRIEVADDGRWAEAGRQPGYGLAVARELSQSMAVQTGATGTRVEVTFALGHPTVVRRGGTRGWLRPADPGAFEVAGPGSGPPEVTVHGPVDLPIVDELRSALLHASGGGTRQVVLDLTACTGVTAAGVRLLYELDRFADPSLRVLAPAGSVAHDVLSLAGLSRLLVDRP